MMEMVLRNDFLEMNPMELEDVSGGALNTLEVMCVTPDTTLIGQNALIGGLNLPAGSIVVKWAIAAALSIFQK